MSLVVLEPGLASRIVDAGRPRSRSLGVPVGGAADCVSFALGNSLVGNRSNSPALEIALKGPSLHAECDLGCVVFGAPFNVDVAGRCIDVGRTFTLRAGENLRIGGAMSGVRAYLCVRGGFHVPHILNSQSALDPIRAGDSLACVRSSIIPRHCPELANVFPALSPNEPCFLAVIPGPQASWFDDAAFYRQRFTVSNASNRMGLRLDGPSLHKLQGEMVSEPVAPGAIQVTNEGQCIILGADGQTIGGYPKIAHVIQADLHRLGQLRPGHPIEFRKVTLTEAVQRSRASLAQLREWSARLLLSLDAVG